MFSGYQMIPEQIEIFPCALSAVGGGDFCFTILNIHTVSGCPYCAFQGNSECSCADFIYSTYFNSSVYDALSVIRFCILTDKINGGYRILIG